ncbi:MAG: serine/threonine protein kinase [Deltaproteobacteria bacterium]|nr:serine/threonine protein kinase [Deltaproteobacteria bacterium]
MPDQSRANTAPPVETLLGERYTLVRFLGSGAMGAVYEVSTPGDERRALKVLLDVAKAESDPQWLTRFVREARVASTLDSEHIVPVVDSGTDAKLAIPYLVMPLLSGLDLDQLLEEVGALHPTVAVRLVMQACEGLTVAHRAKVIHRDIKPANLYLDHDASGLVTVRVLDFGLAKTVAADEGITRAGCIMGTPHYMSPEQSRNAKVVDARTDVWSLAATLYHALTGHVLYEDEQTFADLHLAINSKPVPDIQARAPWIDPGLAKVVHGALLHDVDLRCPSMGDLQAALEPFSLGSSELNAMMLEPVPALCRTVAASKATAVDVWEPGAPSSQLPAVSDEPIEPLLGKVVGGRYTLLRRLGRRGTGALYEALGPDGNRFAVRVLDPEVAGGDPAAARRFVREARSLLAVENRNVVKLVDAAFDDELGQPFIVMELLHGIDLERLVQKHGALEPRLVVPLFLQACRGLAVAHERGVVHRDLKPGNLFLQELPWGEVVVKICGFGLVKRTAAGDQVIETFDITKAGDVVGTPLYMAPEQARNPKNASARSDVWGLGATLYAALTGQPLWSPDLLLADLLLAVGTGPIPDIRDQAPWLSTDLAAAVTKALCRDPDERYPSVDAMAQALAAAARDTTVTLSDLGPVPARLRQAKPPREVASGAGEPSAPGAEPSLPDRGPDLVQPATRRHHRASSGRQVALVAVVVAVIVLAAVALFLATATPDATAPAKGAGSAAGTVAQPPNEQDR